MVQYHHSDGSLSVDPANDRVDDLVNYVDEVQARGIDCPKMATLALLLQETFNTPMDEYLDGVEGSEDRLNRAGTKAERLAGDILDDGFNALFKSDIESIATGLQNAGD